MADDGRDLTDDVVLFVNGFAYAGWESIKITRSIESFAGSFALDVSDRWNDDENIWPITEGDACRVAIGGVSVITGYVDKLSLSGSATSRTLSVTGRDRAADIVDCSVLIPDASTKGNKWTYKNVDIAHFATQIAAQHNVSVSVQPGLVLKKDPSIVAHPGESGFEAIKRAAASAGVLVVSDGTGGIVLTQAGTARAAALVEGENIKEASVEFDATERFRRYLISSQPPGTDDANGEATRVQAQATDTDVKRENRVLVIRPEKGLGAAAARRRADWEARIRAAKAATATITVQGWRQPGGALWPINAIVPVRASRLIRIEGDMLISQVDFSVGPDGKITQLRLVRPDAFTPAPETAATAVVSGEVLWKEITPDVATKGGR
jgi:prophage tail gpP-like protein